MPNPIHVRRDPLGRFDPRKLPGLQLWLRADAVVYQDAARTTRATLDGDPVGGWADQSGSSNHVSQATAGKRPTLKFAIQNGRAVVRNDGVDDLLVGTLALTQPLTVFLAGSKPSSKEALATLRGVSERKNLLVVIERANDVAALSVRNLEEVHVLYADQLNTYDVLVSDDVVFTKAAYEAFVADKVAKNEEDAK